MAGQPDVFLQSKCCRPVSRSKSCRLRQLLLRCHTQKGPLEGGPFLVGWRLPNKHRKFHYLNWLSNYTFYSCPHCCPRNLCPRASCHVWPGHLFQPAEAKPTLSRKPMVSTPLTRPRGTVLSMRAVLEPSSIVPEASPSKNSIRAYFV